MIDGVSGADLGSGLLSVTLPTTSVSAVALLHDRALPGVLQPERAGDPVAGEHLRLTLQKRGTLHDRDPSTGLTTATEKPKLKRPPMFKVILMNDDYTPMEFVVHVLERFFGMNREKATQIMLAVHTTGSAVCGIFPRDIAESKSEQVNKYARENQHPLMSKVEMTD